MLTLAVDFDGTICRHDFPAIGPEIPGAVQTIKDLQKEGIKVILWTCRTGYELAEALEWLKSKGVEFDAVNSNLGARNAYAVPKIYADYYLDDRSIPSFSVLGWPHVRRMFKLEPLKSTGKAAPAAETAQEPVQEAPEAPKGGEPEGEASR